MPQWLPWVLARIRRCVIHGEVELTLKARKELDLLGLEKDDALQVIQGLTASDSAGRLVSAQTGEWMYVFRPQIAGTVIYLKLVLHTTCVVVSFHPEESDDIQDKA